MKLLITGASSILGKNLTTELLKIKNISIRFLEHHTPVKRENCQTFKADVQDAESLIQVCSGIDVVIHMAALTHSGSMKAYFEAGLSCTIRPDHVPTMESEDNKLPGYHFLGRLFALGYLKGLMESVEKSAELTVKIKGGMLVSKRRKLC